MYELKKEKTAIREEYLKKREELDDALKEKLDRKICDSFASLISYRYAEVLLLYYPAKNEIDITSLAQRALKDGKKIAYPCCNPEDHTMVFRIINDFSQLTKVDSFGIPEPDDSCPIYSPDMFRNPGICIVPAVVYDKKGYRIGYGKGYYDRYLSDFNGSKVGFAYSDFVLDKLPKGRFDFAVDVIVTEKSIKVTKL